MDGHQNRENPTSDPPGSPTLSRNQGKTKYISWTREEYREVMYCFYFSGTLSVSTFQKPQKNHTDNTYNMWRNRNKDIREYLDTNKLANVRRDIMNKNHLTNAELNELKLKVQNYFRQEEMNNDESQIGFKEDERMENVDDERIEMEQTDIENNGENSVEDTQAVHVENEEQPEITAFIEKRMDEIKALRDEVIE